MLNHTIYTHMSLPSSILRILLGVSILAMIAGTWNATDFSSWATITFPFFAWALFATLCWLALITIINITLRLSPKLVTKINAKKTWRFFMYHFLPMLMGSICAAALAGPFFIFASSYSSVNTQPLTYWGWPAALWGGLVALTITEWFYQHVQRQDPANNLAKLMELQARIRPHFLFNTLNSAIALVRLDPDAAESVLQNLATLFRAALESGSNSIACVEDEINLAQSYLSIESIRLGERLRIEWDIAPHFFSLAIPQLSLQPLIENAIRHGIEPTSEQGQIFIRASSRLGKLILVISNTMPPPNEERKNQTKGHGIALENLRARLKLLYDFEGSLKTKIKQDSKGQHWFEATMETPTITEHKF